MIHHILGSNINHSSTFLLLVKNVRIANTTASNTIELVSAVIGNIPEWVPAFRPKFLLFGVVFLQQVDARFDFFVAPNPGQKTGSCVLDTDPWPDSTRPKMLTRWLVTRTTRFHLCSHPLHSLATPVDNTLCVRVCSVSYESKREFHDEADVHRASTTFWRRWFHTWRQRQRQVRHQQTLPVPHSHGRYDVTSLYSTL